MNKKIIAIDLGTGNSAVTITEGDKTTIIPAKDTGSMTTPQSLHSQRMVTYLLEMAQHARESQTQRTLYMLSSVS